MQKRNEYKRFSYIQSIAKIFELLDCEFWMNNSADKRASVIAEIVKIQSYMSKVVFEHKAEKPIASKTIEETYLSAILNSKTLIGLFDGDIDKVELCYFSKYDTTSPPIN